MNDLVLTVSDFVAVFNQTIEYAYPLVTVQGELTNFRVSKNRWVYFELKDEFASVKFFGTVYQLTSPLEDGMMLQVSGQPRLHPLYGFSVNIQSLQPVGEGSLKRAATLLEAKLRQEGLFDESRKRVLPYPPHRIGLITSHESAAYHDFIKILNSRWGGIEVLHADVQVQGALAAEQLITALEFFNTHEDPVDVVVITRGGGSPDDLAAFNTEQLTREIGASRIPTLVAIGHEIDTSLAELAADQRASTPSNAAELLVPDRRAELEHLALFRKGLKDLVHQNYEAKVKAHTDDRQTLLKNIEEVLKRHRWDFERSVQLLEALNPHIILKRGYAVIRSDGNVITSANQLRAGQHISLDLSDGKVSAIVSEK